MAAPEAFVAWLRDQMARHHIRSGRKLGEALHLSPSGIGAILRGTHAPNPTTCARMAELFDVPREEVLRLAGHFEPRPQDESTVPVTLVHSYRQLGEEGRQLLDDLARFFAERERAQRKDRTTG